MQQFPVTAFGDESEDHELFVYALAIFRPDHTDEARTVLANMKRSLGVPEDTRLHCRIIFSGQRRRGTPWANVNPPLIQDSVHALVTAVRRLDETPEIGVIERRRVPLLPSVPGHPHREWRPKETLGLAANAAIMGAVLRYGIDRVRVVIDHDETQIQRGLGHQRADATRGFFIDVGQGREPERIEPIVKDDPLLEIADVYAYTMRRVHSRTPGSWFSDLARLIRPNIRRMDLSQGSGPWVDTRNERGT